MTETPARPEKRKIEMTPLVLITSTGEHRRKENSGETFLSRRVEALALILVIAVAVATPAASFYFKEAWGIPARDADGTFNMVGRDPEAGGWSSTELVVHLNETVRIRVHSMDTIHGLSISKFGVDSGPVKYGEPLVVEFVADEVGEFIMSCSIRCSPLHGEMIATMRVVE